MSDIHDMSDETQAPAEPAPPAKADPETLVLRGRTPAVIRFKRNLIIGVTGLGSVALIGTAWFALNPVSFHGVADDKPTVTSKSGTPEALAGAPSSYGDIPKLGVPLPGDLGRPFLERQQQLNGMGNTDPNAATAQQALAAERQQAAQTAKAAREAGLMVQRVGGAAGNAEIATSSSLASGDPKLDSLVTAAADSAHASSESDPNGQRHKADFLSASNTQSDINPHSLSVAPSPWTVSAGSVIAASLLTGLNSDLPGFVTAQITENVRDSVTGKTILIPQGARLIGKYDSVVAFGQSRALVVWQRIILPDGSSLDIDNLPATDTAGYAGLADKVDLHSWKLLKGIGLSTLLGVGTQLSLGSSSADLLSALRQSAEQSADKVGQQITAKELDVQPTITVRPGWPLRVIVHKDLVFSKPWRGGF